MQKQFLNILSAVGLIVMAACSPSKLGPSEYVAWMDNPGNNLVREYQQGTIRLTCQFTTPEYVSLKQSNPDHLDAFALEENIQAFSDMIHFRLRFEDTTSTNFLRNNYTTPEEFNTRSMYLSYDIRYDLKLVQDGDTSECVLNHHERTYGSTPYETLLLAFPKRENGTADTELISDDRVFGLGRVKFFFSRDDLQAIPNLEI